MNARFLAAAVAALLAVQATASAQTVDKDFPLGGATVARLNVSGHIHVMNDGPAGVVHLHVVDYGPSVPALRMSSVRTGRRLAITITGPAQSNIPFVGASGYEMELHVPPNVKLDLREFSGRIRVDAVTTDSQFYDANGNIEIGDARAQVTAEADLGDVTIAIAHRNVIVSTGTGNSKATLASDWSGDHIRMEASDGNMTLYAPAGFHANFDVTPANGKLVNQFRSTGKKPVVFMLSQKGNITISTPPNP